MAPPDPNRSVVTTNLAGETASRPETLRGALDRKLVVKNDVEKRTVNLQCIASVIINESQFPEPVHEKANPRASRAYHFCEGLLTHFGDESFGFTVLAEMSQQ